MHMRWLTGQCCWAVLLGCDGGTARMGGELELGLWVDECHGLGFFHRYGDCDRDDCYPADCDCYERGTPSLITSFRSRGPC